MGITGGNPASSLASQPPQKPTPKTKEKLSRKSSCYLQTWCSSDSLCVERATCHTLRHSFATHMLENGINIRVLQELMGHAYVKIAEIYTHVMKRDITSLQSPLDRLSG